MDYFGEIEELIIRLDDNGVSEEFYIGPDETDGQYEEKIGDIKFTLPYEISFRFDSLKEINFT